MCTMALSVSDALRVPALREADVRVLAGADHLDRPLRWVHVVEQTEIAHLLHGGELLLTTGQGLTENDTAPDRFLRQVIDSGAAGLVIELGPRVREVPPVLVRMAENAGLPLVTLAHETRFVEVTEQVHRAIIDRQHTLLEQVETLNREFSTLVLGGAAVDTLLQHLSTAVGNPVVLEDRAHQVVAYASHGAADDDTQSLLADWQRHSRARHHEPRTAGVHVEDGSPPCVWAGIWLRHEPWGRVHILGTRSAPDDLTRLLLDRASLTLSLALLGQADEEHLSDRAAHSLLNDLAAGRYESAEGALSRARALGSDLADGVLVAVVVDMTNLTDIASRQALGESRLQRLRLRLRAGFRGSLTACGCAGLTALDGDRILALVAIPTSRSFASTLERLATGARSELSGIEPDLHVVVGASRRARWEATGRAFDEARIAVEFGSHTADRALYQFGDLGTYPLLRRLAQGPELAAYVESQLGPLLQHDAASGFPLLPTLRVYLAHAGRKADAVRELHVQRRTLYARLARIERLLERDLRDQDTRTELTLALHGLTLLNQRR